MSETPVLASWRQKISWRLPNYLLDDATFSGILLSEATEAAQTTATIAGTLTIDSWQATAAPTPETKLALILALIGGAAIIAGLVLTICPQLLITSAPNDITPTPAEF
jgi:hypothetical protein